MEKEYYRGSHGELRRVETKIHLTKKRKRYLRMVAKQAARKELEVK